MDVARRPDPADRRASIIELTARGRQVTRAASRTAAAEVERLETRWGPVALKSFTGMPDDLAGDGTPRPVVTPCGDGTRHDEVAGNDLAGWTKIPGPTGPNLPAAARVVSYTDGVGACLAGRTR